MSLPLQSSRTALMASLHLGSLTRIGAGAMAAASVLGLSTSAIAAEDIFLDYPPFQQSIRVEDLRTFAETGEQTPNIRLLLDVTDTDPQPVRDGLTAELQLDLQFADEVLYTLPGEYLLFQLGQIIHTPSRRANIQALRSTMILSLSDDNQVSLLEFLENYPIDRVYIDARELSRAQRDLSDALEDIEPLLATIETFLSDLVCDCQVTPAADPEDTPPDEIEEEIEPVDADIQAWQPESTPESALEMP